MTSFRYKGISRPDGSIAKCPVAQVRLSGQERFETPALIDSGAEVTTMPHSTAEAIGLDLSAEPERSFGVGGPVASIASSVGVSLRLGHETKRFSIPVMVVKGDFPVLFGRRGFFSRFRITFDEQAERVTLKPNKSRIY